MIIAVSLFCNPLKYKPKNPFTISCLSIDNRAKLESSYLPT